MSFVISGSGDLSGAVVCVPSIWIRLGDPWTRVCPQPANAVNLFASAAVNNSNSAVTLTPRAVDLYHWVESGVEVRNVGAIKPSGNVIPSGFAVGDQLPDYFLLGLGGVSVDCELVSNNPGGLTPNRAYLNINNGEFYLGAGLILETLQYGLDTVQSLVVGGDNKARVWVNTLRVGLGLVLSDCIYGVLNCRLVISDSDLPLPAGISPTEFYLSLASGLCVFSSVYISGRVLKILGVGVSSNPVPNVRHVVLNANGRGQVPAADSLTLWPSNLAGWSRGPITAVGDRPSAWGVVTENSGELFIVGKRDLLAIVEYDSDLPTQGYGLNRERGYYSLESGALQVRSGVGNEVVDFKCGLVPVGFEAPVGVVSLVGLLRGPFDLSGETFVFALDGVVTSFTLPIGRYTSGQLAVLLNAASGVPNAWFDLAGGLACVANASIEIGWGDARIGFAQGWIVTSGARWNSYNGLAMGLYRQVGEGDLTVRLYGEVDDEILVEKIGESSLVYLGQGFPDALQSGYEPDGFFEIVGSNGLISQPLSGRPTAGVFTSSWGVGLLLDCVERNRFSWVERFETGSISVDNGVDQITLDGLGVISLTLEVQEPNLPWLPQEYVLVGNTALFSSRIGADLLSGGVGESVSGVFTDVTIADFTVANVNVGDLLVTSDNLVYRIISVAAGALGLYPSDSFGLVGWQVLDTEPVGLAVYDPALIADRQFLQLPTWDGGDPFAIRVITPLSGATANLSKPYAKSLRYGAVDAGNSALDLLVRGVSMGALSSQMQMPAFVLSDPHYTTSTAGGFYFSLRVPTAVIVITSAFTVPSPPLGVIEVGLFGSGISGQVRVASNLVTAYADLLVYYDQEFLPAGVIVNAEGDIATGALNIPTAYAGESLFLVEKYTSDSVTVSPVPGTAFFQTPIEPRQYVEATYYPTNSGGVNKTGDLIVEFMPISIRLEEATRINARLYSFNPSGLAYDSASEPMIWVGAEMQNYSGNLTATVNGALSQIAFTYDVPITSKVQITYSVLNAPLGTASQSYQVTQAPVWQPPFWLNAGQSVFVLEGDRTATVAPDHLIGVGGKYVAYVQGVTLLPSGDTQVEIYPAPVREVGSRSPGVDQGLVITDRNVTDVDFIQVVPNAFLGAGVGASLIQFYGDARSIIAPRHLIDLDGVPYLVQNVQLTSDGRKTVAYLQIPLQRDVAEGSVVKCSFRPIYQNQPIDFTISGTQITGTSFTAILFSSDSSIPGKVLVPNTQYVVENGALKFQTQFQTPLQPNERLYASYTKSKVISPTMIDDALVVPKYRATYLAITQPSDANGLLGGVLKGKYFYLDAESFTLKIQPIADYLPIVLLDAARRPENPDDTATPTPFPQGGAVTVQKQAENARNAYWDALNLDAGGRVFVTLFNNAVTPFEQVLETIDGRVIGDRDGKLRLYVGPESVTPIAGGVYALTSHLYPRVVWRDLLEAWSPNTSGWFFMPDDFIYDPRSITLGVNPGSLNGYPPSGPDLDFFIDLQREYQRNDVDDVLMTSFKRNVTLANTLLPVITFKGRFESAWQPNAFSRLYPEQTRYFTRLLPGLEAQIDANTGEVIDAGFYSAGRLLPVAGTQPGTTVNKVVKTRNTVIGQISNPVLGELKNVSDITANDRGPRARVWAYYPNGNAALDAALALATPTVGRATLVLTPQTINDFVIDQITGFPDTSLLVTNGGANPDVNSGDAELSTPEFASGDQILLGNPDGTVRTVYLPASGLGAAENPVFVDDIQAGCVVFLKDLNNSALSGAQIFMSDPISGGGISFDPTQGDTIFTPTSQAAIAPNLVSDPVSLADAAKLIETNGDYRIQNDLKVRRRTGQILDASLPVVEDIWGLPIQDWAGQNPPLPGSCIEGTADIINADSEPARLPALFGGTRDDSGDNQIPFLALGNTEIRLLQQASRLFDGLFLDSAAPVQAVYPDEIAVSDGVIYGAVTGGLEPATLYTATANFTPVFVAGSGVGPARQRDFLLVQTGQSPIGITGIQSIGSVSADSVEPPRFVTNTQRGDLHRYTAQNLFGHKGGGTTGLRITEVGFARLFDFSDVAGIVLDDGLGAGNGGLDALINLGVSPGNVLVINVYNPSPLAVNAYLGSVVIPSTVLAAVIYYKPAVGVAVSTNLTPPGWTLLNSTQLQINAVASVLSTLGLVSGQAYDFTLTVDTYVDTTTSNLTSGALAVGSALGSTSCSIRVNRLTFDERVSFASALPRNTNPANGDGSIEMGLALNVFESPVGAGAVISTVNNASEINGGLYLTFLARTYGVGTFTAATLPATEIGSVRAMAWEGHGNTPITATNLVVSAVPSSERDAAGVICDGSGVILDAVAPYATENVTWLQTLAVANGAVANVESGDVAIVNGGLITGAVKTGTYLVRHAVTETAFGLRPIKNSTLAGSKTCFDLRFPTVVSISGVLSLTVGNVQPVLYSPTGCGFPSSGFVYVIRNDVWVTWSAGVYTLNAEAVYKLGYSAVAYNAATKTAVFTLTGLRLKADGSPITPSELALGVTANLKVSGFKYLPIGRLADDLPDNNLVGFGSAGGIAGVTNVTIGTQAIAGAPVASFTWNTASVPALVQDLSGAGPAANQLAVRVPTPNDSTAFYADTNAVIYGRVDNGVNPVTGVASHLDLTTIDWDTVHFNPVFAPTVLQCLLPGDEVAFSDSISPLANPGFSAVAGIFLEPSIPKPVGDLNSLDPHVVTASHTTLDVGIRKYGDFVALGTQETVQFAIRRIRRFHDVQTNLSAIIDPLRFVYETRRGPIAVPIATPTVNVTFADGTTLGFFDDPDVAVKPSCTLRVLNAAGDVLDTAEIRAVLSSTSLLLREPGLTQDLTSAASFEIYLVDAPVPHEQSCAQLLDALVDPNGGGSIVYKRTVDYSTYPFGNGGSVITANELLDAGLATLTSSELVLQDDYVIVDPAGALFAAGETGLFPNGDTSVSGRVPFVAGRPSKLDDNRGFYRVTANQTSGDNKLVVSGTTQFSGSDELGGDDVIYGDVGAEYAVLPTISGSLVSQGPTEGQQTLRVTASADGTGAFLGRVGDAQYRSLEPFGFTVIRPARTVFSSNESIETTLFMRERMLSLIQYMASAYGRGGTYYVFQRDDQIENLPNPSDVLVGQGVFTNAIVDLLRGLTNYAPFANNPICLSVHDRRLWIKDFALDYESPNGVAPFYAALSTNGLNQRPILTDFIDDVLDNVDDLHGARYAWLEYRTNQVNGTIVSASRSKERINQVRVKQANAIRRSR